MNSSNYGGFNSIPEVMIKKLGEIFMKDEQEYPWKQDSEGDNYINPNIKRKRIS